MFEGIEILETRGAPPERATALVCDSRAVEPGALFVALRGETFDGHDFILQAEEKGACAAVVERVCEHATLPQIRVADALAALPRLAANFYRSPARSLSLIGVTGSNGKTTSTYLLEQIWRAAGREAAVVGTIEYRYKDFHQEASNTTPLPHDMQRLLRDLVDRGCHEVMMEVSSHGLMLHRVDEMEFDAALFTNLSQDHLDFHQTMGAYREAKKRLFTKHLKADGAAVLNIDDEAGRWYYDELPNRRRTAYACERPADIRAEHIEIRLDGCRFDLRFGEKATVSVHTPLIGLHNVYNALGAAATAWAMGIDRDAILSAVERFAPAPGRLENVPNGVGAQVVVDYSHTPDALEKCLLALGALPHQRILTVFGCGGDRDRGKRPKMGAIAQRLSDFVYITSDNPRTEDPQRILADIEEGMTADAGRYTVMADRREAIGAAVNDLQPGDVLLIAGKGHETYQLIGRVKHPFDDREVARDALAAAGKGA